MGKIKRFQNELYSQIHDHQNMIENRSYSPISGKFIEISLPLDEQAFYGELGTTRVPDELSDKE